MMKQKRLARLRTKVLAAIREFDRVGEAVFLERYKYGASRKYDLFHKNRRYPPKAIWGVALHSGPDLHQRPFWLHGGEQTNRRLRELKFTVVLKDEIGTLSKRDIDNLPSRLDDVLIRLGIRYRKGQPRFRDALTKVYGGRCAITRCPIAGLLDAAHVKPHSEFGDYSLDNGVLLRTDIHTLFDMGLIRINPTNYRVDVDEGIRDRNYRILHDKKIVQPRLPKHRIRTSYLEARWQPTNKE